MTTGEYLHELLTGPLHLRVLIQPLVALAFAIRDGRLDARLGRAPFFLSLFTTERGESLASGARSLAKVWCFAIVLDALAQTLIFGKVRPLAAVVMGTLLIWLPYSLGRGAANRAIRTNRPTPA